jgi:hypothetical protein
LLVHFVPYHLFQGSFANLDGDDAENEALQELVTQAAKEEGGAGNFDFAEEITHVLYREILFDFAEEIIHLFDFVEVIQNTR